MKTAWKPIYNATLRNYGVYRLLDDSKADSAGNREYHSSGAIFADEKTAQRLCDELNEVESNGKGI